MEDALRTERETRKFRLLALLFVVAGVYFQRYEVPLWPAVGLSFLYLAYLSSVWFLLIPRVPAVWLPYVTMVADTVFVSGTLALLGVDSAFFVLFPILIIYHAIYLGYIGSFLCATLIAFAYIGLAFLQQADVGLGRLLPMQIPLFYLIALFSGYLAQRRLGEAKERQELSLLLQAERGARSSLDLTSSFATVLDIEQLQKQITHMLMSAAQCTHGAIALADDGNGESSSPVALPAGWMRGAATEKSGSGSTAPLLRAALEKGSFFEQHDPDPKRLPAWASGLAPAYVLVVSLADGGSCKGIVWLFSTTPHSGLGPTQADLIQSMAKFFVPLVANAQAYAIAQKESSRLSSELRGAIQQMARAQQLQKKPDIRVGQLRLEAAQAQATLGSQQLDLSAREFDVLYFLAQHAGRPVSQEVLLRTVWGDAGNTRSNVVDVAINRLRRKLALQANASDLVETVRGVGYKLSESAQVPAATSEATPSSPGRDQKGELLLEHVITLAVVAVWIPALLAVLTTFINNSDIYHDRVVTMELAHSQIESIKKEPFQASPASYPLLSSLPAGYSIVFATGEATRYTYANGTIAPEVLQAITVTVTGRYGSLQAMEYKYRE